jgi:hypothetical protein
VASSSSQRLRTASGACSAALHKSSASVKAEPLAIVDYTYLAQLPPLLFQNDVWQLARQKLQGANDVKAKLNEAIGHIAKVRNEIAHVREVPMDRLKRADVACDDVCAIVGRPS